MCRGYYWLCICMCGFADTTIDTETIISADDNVDKVSVVKPAGQLKIEKSGGYFVNGNLTNENIVNNAGELSVDGTLQNDGQIENIGTLNGNTLKNSKTISGVTGSLNVK